MSQQLEDVMTELDLDLDLDLDLARAAVAMPGWRWMPGMLTIEEAPTPPMVAIPKWDACRVLAADPAEPVRVYPMWRGQVRKLHRGALPDYRDPATAGCLLAMLGPGWYGGSESTADGRSWGWVDNADVDYGEDRPEGNTLGEACIRAAIARGGWGVR